jgi:hypothetical protein
MSNVINIFSGKQKPKNELTYSPNEWCGQALDLIGNICADVEGNATKEDLLAALIKLSVLVLDISLTPEEWAFMNPTDGELEWWEHNLTPEDKKSFEEHKNSFKAHINSDDVGLKKGDRYEH